MDEGIGQNGWIGLLVAGVVNLLYGLGYFVWTLISLIFGGLMAVASIGAALDTGDPSQMVIGVLMAVTPIIQAIVFLIVPILGAIAIFAALRFKRFESKGLVWFGIIGTILGPALGLLSSVASCCSGGCCGFVVGNIGTIIAGVLVLASAGFAIFCMMQEDVQAAFAANEDALA